MYIVVHEKVFMGHICGTPCILYYMYIVYGQ